MFRAFILLIVLTAAIGVAASAYGQPMEPHQAAQKLFLRRDLALDAIFERLKKAVRAAEQEKALAVYEELGSFLDVRGDDFLLSLDGDVYRPVRQVVHELLIGLPAEMMEQFSAVSIESAAEALKDARARSDSERLEEVTASYPLTRSAAYALHHLSFIQLERGEYEGAVGAVWRALRYGAFSAQQRKQLQIIEALCLYITGEEGAAESQLARLERESPKSMTRAGGRVVPLSELVGNVRAAAARLTAGQRPARQVRIAPRGQRFSYKLKEPLITGAFITDLERNRNSVPYLLEAVAGGGKIFVSDNCQVVALDASGKERWRYRVNPAVVKPRDLITRLYRPAVSGKRVIATLNDSLYCLDAQTGKPLWTTAGVALEGACYVSSPALSGSVALVSVTEQRQEVQFSLFGFDVQTGALLWKRLIISGFPTDLFGAGVNSSPPAVAGDRAFCQTNMGALGCVRVSDGTLLWVARYGSLPSGSMCDAIESGRRWARSAPAVCGSVVVVAAADSNYLMAFEIDSGSLLWRFPRVGRAEFRRLAGIASGKVIVAGDAVAAIGMRTGKLIWMSGLPGYVVAAPALAGGAVAVPIADRVLIFDINRGERTHVMWLSDPPEQCGNLLISGDMIVSSSHNIISGFGCKEGERDRVCVRKIEQAAEALAGAGEYLKAIQELHKALKENRDPQLLIKIARYYERASLLESAVQTYQYIIKEFTGLPVTVDGYSGIGCADYATACIDSILRENGRELYKRYEGEAAKGLGNLSDNIAIMEQQLRRITREFPNSVASQEARLALARLFISEELYQHAIMALAGYRRRAAALGIADSERDAAQATVLLVHCYEKRGELYIAKAHLRQLVDCEAEIELAGERLAASEFGRRQLEAGCYRSLDVSKRLDLPLLKLWQTVPLVLDRGARLLAPGKLPEGDVFLVLSNHLLEARRSSDGTLIWRQELAPLSIRALGRDAAKGTVTGDVVVLVVRSVVYCYRITDGELLWSCPIPLLEAPPGSVRSVVSALVASDEATFLATKDGCVMVLDVGSGKLLWSVKTGERLFPRLILHKRRLIAVTATGRVIALNIADGKKLFDMKVCDRLSVGVSNGLTQCGDKLFLLCGRSNLLCVDIQNGGLLWKQHISVPAQDILPVEAAKALIIISTDKKKRCIVRSLDVSGGKFLWRKELAAGKYVGALADKGRAFIAIEKQSAGCRLYALQLKNGKELWKWEKGSDSVARLVDAGDYIVMPSPSYFSGSFAIVDKRNGATAFEAATGGMRIASIAAVQNRLIVVTDRSFFGFGAVDFAELCELVARWKRELESDSAAEVTGRLAGAYFALGKAEEAARHLSDALLSEELITKQGLFRQLHGQLAGIRFAEVSERHMISASELLDAPKIEGKIEGCWHKYYALRLEELTNIFRVQQPAGRGWMWRCKEDLSGKLYLGWDRENFYFTLDVADDVTVPYEEDKGCWKGDLLFIALDMKGDGGYTFDNNDALLTLGLFVPKKDEDKEEKKKPPGIYFVKRKDDGSGAIYQAAIPWSMFRDAGVVIPEQGPQDGFSFGFNLLLTDDDTSRGATKSLNLTPGFLLGPANSIWETFIPNRFARIVLNKSESTRNE